LQLRLEQERKEKKKQKEKVHECRNPSITMGDPLHTFSSYLLGVSLRAGHWVNLPRAARMILPTWFSAEDFSHKEVQFK